MEGGRQKAKPFNSASTAVGNCANQWCSVGVIYETIFAGKRIKSSFLNFSRIRNVATNFKDIVLEVVIGLTAKISELLRYRILVHE